MSSDSNVSPTTLLLAVAFTLPLAGFLCSIFALCIVYCCRLKSDRPFSALVLTLYMLSVCLFALSGAAGIASLAKHGSGAKVTSAVCGVTAIMLLDVYMVLAALDNLEARRSYYYGLAALMALLVLTSGALASLLTITTHASTFTAVLVSRTFIHISFDLLVVFLLSRNELRVDALRQPEHDTSSGSIVNPRGRVMKRCSRKWLLTVVRGKLVFSEYRLITLEALSIISFILSGSLPHQWLPDDAPHAATALSVIPAPASFLALHVLLLLRYLGVGADLALSKAQASVNKDELTNVDDWSIVSTSDIRESSAAAVVNHWCRQARDLEGIASAYPPTATLGASSMASSSTPSCSWPSSLPSPTQIKSRGRHHWLSEPTSLMHSQSHSHNRSMPSPSPLPRAQSRRCATPPLLFGRHSTTDLKQTGQSSPSQILHASRSAPGLRYVSKISSTAPSSTTLDLQLEHDDPFSRYRPSMQAIDTWRKRSSEAMSRQSYDSATSKSPKDCYSPVSFHTPRRKASTDELGRISVVFEEDGLVMPNLDHGTALEHGKFRGHAGQVQPLSLPRQREGSSLSQSHSLQGAFVRSPPRARRPAMAPIDMSVSAPGRMRSGTGSSIYYDPFPPPGSATGPTETVSRPSTSPLASRSPSFTRLPSSLRAPSLSSPRRALVTLKKLKERASLSALVPDLTSNVSEPSDLSFACAGMIRSSYQASTRNSSEQPPATDVEPVMVPLRLPKPARMGQWPNETIRSSSTTGRAQRWWRSSAGTFSKRGKEPDNSVSRSRAASSPWPRTAYEPYNFPQPRPSSCWGDLEHRLPTPRPLSPLSVALPHQDTSDRFGGEEQGTDNDTPLVRTRQLWQEQAQTARSGFVEHLGCNALGLMMSGEEAANSLSSGTTGLGSPLSDAFTWSQGEDLSFSLGPPSFDAGRFGQLDAQEMLRA